MKKLSVLALILLLTASMLAACGSSGNNAAGGTDSPGEGGSGSGAGSAAEGEIYIPIISKGFQHQFWQAVKAGAEQAGKSLACGLPLKVRKRNPRWISRSKCCRPRSTRNQARSALPHWIARLPYLI